MVPVSLSRLLIREMADMQLVELSELDGTRRFPIVIGLPEAMAIERRCKGITVERPQTHDLLASTIEALGGKLLRVELNDLQGGTFFARLIIEQGGHEIKVDARPSDAIALAAAGDVPILVAEHVIDEAAIDISGQESVDQASEEEEDDASDASGSDDSDGSDAWEGPGGSDDD